jgi:3-oxoacyl-(acyl-carrier-protein) synthase
VPGEAAAAIVLVRAADAAAPLAWIDAANGAGPEAASTATLAGVAARLVGGSPERVGVVAGAARARPELDAAERGAIAALVGADTPLVAPSAAMGQLGAATSVVQAIVLAELLRARRLPPIAGLAHAAAGPLVPAVRDTPLPPATRVALGLHAAAPGLAGVVRVEVPA